MKQNVTPVTIKNSYGHNTLRRAMLMALQRLMVKKAIDNPDTRAHNFTIEYARNKA
jgi:hypothetical protein